MGMGKGENVNQRRNGSKKDNGTGIMTAIGKGAQIGIRMAVDREERAEIMKGNEDKKECEWGPEKTRSRTMKRMKKMKMNKENLNKKSEFSQKEASYQECLQNWESRDQKKTWEHEKEAEREERREMAKEAKELK
ncbi:hypothetical protein GH733_008001 [Mirounga leonina]|nr:hypothetical protein GH733_008001 [Mirounga leonina]